MKMVKTIFLAFLFSSLAIATGRAQETNPPGSIKLLPGYHHRTGQGIDVVVGTISKEGGLKIDYDIGDMDSTQFPPLFGKGGEVWRKRQIINGQTMVCAYTKKKELVVTFLESHALFYATIKSDEQMVDMLLMLTTFQPEYSRP